jgi:hypothetical protein
MLIINEYCEATEEITDEREREREREHKVVPYLLRNHPLPVKGSL